MEKFQKSRFRDRPVACKWTRAFRLWCPKFLLSRCPIEKWSEESPGPKSVKEAISRLRMALGCVSDLFWKVLSSVKNAFLSSFLEISWSGGAPEISTGPQKFYISKLWEISFRNIFYGLCVRCFPDATDTREDDHEMLQYQARMSARRPQKRDFWNFSIFQVENFCFPVVQSKNEVTNPQGSNRSKKRFPASD